MHGANTSTGHRTVQRATLQQIHLRCCHADMLPAKDALHINRIAAFLGHLAVAAEVKAEGDKAKELPLQVGVGGAWEARSRAFRLQARAYSWLQLCHKAGAL